MRTEIWSESLRVAMSCALSIVRAMTHSVAEVGSKRLIVTYPDETLHGAIKREESRRLSCRASIMQARQRYHAEEEDRARGFIRSDAGLAPTDW
jgi:hypothetical protein